MMEIKDIKINKDRNESCSIDKKHIPKRRVKKPENELENKHEAHFKIDINFLCSHYLQKQYEEWIVLGNSKKDEYYKDFTDYNHIYVYPIWDELRMDDLDLEELLEKFVRTVLNYTGDEEFTLNQYILESYAKWIFNEYITTRDSYLKTVEKRLKVKRIKDIVAINKEEGKPDCWVLDKNTEITHVCNFGGHWFKVTEILIEHFGAEFVQDEINYPVLDDYIKENLILHGNYYPVEAYVIKNQDDLGISLLKSNARLRKWKNEG